MIDSPLTASPDHAERWWRRPELRPLGGAVALLLLILANHSLNDRSFTLRMAIALGLGLAVWAALIWNGRDLLPSLGGNLASDPPLRRVQQVLLVLIVPLLVIAWAEARGNTFRPLGVAAWLLAIGLWLVAWWPSRGGQLVGDASTPGRPRLVPPAVDWLRGATCQPAPLVLTILAVMLLATFFRVYDLNGTPLDPTSDHAEKLYDVNDVLEGMRPIFFERNTGREPAQFYLTAGLIESLNIPLSFTTLKFGTALIGVAAIPFVYLLGAELLGRLAGLFAATLFAMSKWMVATSRAGLRFPYAPLATAATFWLMLRWMRTGDRRDALWCGVAIGAGLYGYTPFRVMVVAVVMGFGLSLFNPRWRGERARVIRHGLLIGATAAIVFLPLGRYSFDYPDNFWYRTTSSIGGEDSQSAIDEVLGNLSVFLENNVNAALAFNWKGDGGFANAVTDDPFLDLIAGALFLAGVVTVVIALVRRGDRRLLFLVLSLPILLLASTLVIETPWENPSVNRSGGIAPVIFVVAAWPLALMARWTTAVITPRGWRVAAGSCALLLAVGGIANYDRYFNDFDRQSRSIVANTTAIASAIEAARVVGVTIDDVYIIDSPYWLDIRNIAIALGDLQWASEHNITPGNPLPDQEPGRPLFFVINQGDEDRLAEVGTVFPQGVLTYVETDVPPKNFYTYWVPVQE